MSHRPKRGARHTRPDAPETPHPAADLSQRASALSRWRGWLTALGVVLALLVGGLALYVRAPGPSPAAPGAVAASSTTQASARFVGAAVC